MIRSIFRISCWSIFLASLVLLGHYLHTNVAPAPIGFVEGNHGFFVDNDRWLITDEHWTPNKLTIYDIRSGECRVCFGGQQVSNTDVTDDRRYLLVYLGNGKNGVHDLVTEKAWYWHGPAFFVVASTDPTANYLLVASEDDKIGTMLLDVRNQHLNHMFPPETWGHGFTRDGKSLLLSLPPVKSEGEKHELQPLVVWDVDKKREAHRLGSYPESVVLLTDRDQAFVASSGDQQSRIDLWDIRTGTLVASRQPSINLQDHKIALEVSPDGRWLALFAVNGDAVGIVEFWDLHAPSLGPAHSHAAILHGSFAYFRERGIFNPDSTACVICDDAGGLEWIDLATGKTRWQQSFDPSFDRLKSDCWFDHEGRQLVAVELRNYGGEPGYGLHAQPVIRDADSGAILRKWSGPTAICPIVNGPPGALLFVQEARGTNGRESSFVMDWLAKLAPSLFDSNSRRNRAQVVVLDENIEPVFDFSLDFARGGSLSRDGKTLAIHFHHPQSGRTWTEFYALPAGFRFGLVIGVPMGLGLLILSCRWAWRRWRARRRRLVSSQTAPS